MTEAALDEAYADAATRSLLESTTALCRSVGPQGFSRSADGVAAFVSGGRIPTLNAVVVTQADADLAGVASLLDEVAATGVPHCVQVRPAALDLTRELLAARGKSFQFDLPLMVRIGPAPSAAELDGLAVRVLGSDEIDAHVQTAAAGFEVPPEILAEVMTSGTLVAPGVRGYLGEVADRPVTTGIGMLAGGWIGVFNIATPPAHRGRGYGSAVTARIVADGLAAGAEGAYLQSSPAGHNAYERLGFRTVEVWSVWA